LLLQIIELLMQRGYGSIDDETGGVLFRESEDKVFAVTLSYAAKDDSVEEYMLIQRRMEFMLGTRLRKKVECLHIILTEDGMFEDKENALIEHLSNVWYVARDTGRIYIFERQLTDFDNLRNELEDCLRRRAEYKKQNTAFKRTPVNIGIVITNIVVFLAIGLIYKDFFAVYNSDIMLAMGALSYETFVDGAWYQIITSFFLHFGFTHLLNNMILLTYAGCELERRIGSIPYLIIYMFSGVLGNVASLIYYHGQGEQVVSAGASGAIYGVIGALFVILVFRKSQSPSLSPMRLLVMIVLTIYHGITSVGVDNAAHIGGLLAGIVSGFLLSKILRYDKLKEVNFMR